MRQTIQNAYVFPTRSEIKSLFYLTKRVFALLLVS